MSIALFILQLYICNLFNADEHRPTADIKELSHSEFETNDMRRLANTVWSLIPICKNPFKWKSKRTAYLLSCAIKMWSNLWGSDEGLPTINHSVSPTHALTPISLMTSSNLNLPADQDVVLHFVGMSPALRQG